MGDTTYRARWGSEPLPIDDAAYDVVHASHVIEHIPWYDVRGACDEVYRILRPGGVFEVHTVDFERVMSVALNHGEGDGWTCGGRVRTLMDWVNARVFAYERDGENNWHKSLFTLEYLTDILIGCGFVSVIPCSPNHHGVIDLAVRAYKP